MILARKSFLTSMAAASVMAPVMSPAVEPLGRADAISAALLREDTLAYHAAKKGLLFGSVIGRGFFDDPDYVRLVKSECSLVCASLISAGVTRRQRAFDRGFNFKLGDQEVSFAETSELAVFGGYLVVHGDEPTWMKPDTDRIKALTEMQNIITTTMTRYAGKVDHWIVVNEALSQSGLRNCTWLSTVGPTYVAEAFKAARKASPEAILVLNEDGLEPADAAQKRAVMLKLLTSFRDNGIPVDALGIQSHLFPNRPVDAAMFTSFLDSVNALGIRVVLTELDVVDASLPADVKLRDLTVAQLLGDYLSITLAHPSILSVTSWGLSDKYSWYNSDHTPANLRRSDGMPSRGTLFDDGFKRKAAYFAVRDALDRAKRTVAS